ncbi:hypothetical protein LB565_18695 [Mesorhizobium sp. CA14]|uniref:hypothetical protein n=1 Tax=Mesorhizobium sp. CA14 TaxID=2876642 RepID=UPI001CCBCEBE|nr:hypothetical protein [Mesorhizobium sp. CA14]MBZ9850015.1 hypothetical protein [Mesorhizobium sp. CA14]
MNPEVLARFLFETAPHPEGYTEPPIVLYEGEWSPLPEETPVIGPTKDRAIQLVEDIAQKLKDSNWRPDLRPAFQPDCGPWKFGVIRQRAAIRKIHRGYLEPFRRFAFVDDLPELVALFLIGLPGGEDYLDRDNHSVGWHYHYLPDRYTRSDVILSWDTRWVPPNQCAIRPIFEEKHGEGRYSFRANPWLWGDAKKQSMHEMCAPDLRRWPIETFRCASNKAGAVWPATATLTPVPVAASVGSRTAKKKRSGRR